mmetsp:Transcript_1957/g.2769  ORF Transcript_1957/g.2769 Transcript_1957/m.2769 type:complete len:139 (-) Transcript_1957:71-487(-)
MAFYGSPTPLNAKARYISGCITNIIPSSIVMGGILHFLQGNMRINLREWGVYSGFLISYNSLKCGLEGLHGRRIALHDGIAGAVVGYIGVERRMIGIPFAENLVYFFHRGVRPSVVGAGVYGLMGIVLGGALAGKPLV